MAHQTYYRGTEVLVADEALDTMLTARGWSTDEPAGLAIRDTVVQVGDNPPPEGLVIGSISQPPTPAKKASAPRKRAAKKAADPKPDQG